MVRQEMPETRAEAKVKAKLHRLPNVDLYADRLSGDPRLGFMRAGRSASNLKRAPVFRSSRLA